MKLLKSFWFAICGIWHCVRYERNMRIHILAMITVFIFSYLYGVERSQCAILALTIAMVMSFEAFNTAIEKAIDISAPEFNPIAKVAKDVSAGGVLIAAVASIIVAIFIFGDTVRLLNVLEKFTGPLWIAGLTGYIILGAIFVFSVPKKDKQKGNNK